jgi:hypothetical protein
MRRVLLFSAFAICLSANVNAQSAKPALKAQASQPAATTSPSPAAVTAARASFARLPLSFEENVGQTDGRVKYMSRGTGYNLFLTADQAVFALRDGSAPPNCTGLNRKIASDCAHPSNRPAQEADLWLKMTAANASAQILGSDLLPGKINYYVGNDPSKWRIGVRQFGRVNYKGIYPGVDLTYYGNQQQLESDFVVAPGANPQSIQFEVKGARETRIDAQGNLVLASSVGNVRLLRPVVYQVVKGAKHDVSGRYVLLAENRVGFEIGKYDAHEPLVIDPTFVYSTYLGGGTLSSGGDQGLAIAIDAAGAAYVTGTGSSFDFPGSAQSGPVAQTTPFAFVTKFDPTGGTLVYSTLLRGTTGFTDSGNGIAVDGSGNAYVAGVTSDSDFPLLNPFQATIGDVFSAGFNFIQSGFVSGLDSNGALIYSTYFGGRSDTDRTALSGLAVDAAGNAYVVGDTTSNNFPTVNPYQATLNGSTNVVVAKFNPQGQPIYSTYLGGGGTDLGNAIAIDGNGNAYVTGQTSSNAMFETGFPVQSSPAPFQAVINGGANAFVSKFSFASPNLTLANSTYLGGSATDEAFGIAVDHATPPNVYLTGQTTSKTGTTFPTLNPIFGATASSTSEAFVTKLKGDFTALVYSTFLGGTGTTDGTTGDIGYDIALDGANPPNAFVTGSTASTDFPVAQPLQSTLSVLTDGTNAFITEVNGTGTAPLTYSTFLGGRGQDLAHGIAVDSTGNAYITGTTTSTNFPVLGSSGAAPYQSELHTSSGNAFVTKISPAAAASALNFFPPSFNFHDQGIGQPSQPENVTLSNNTGSAVTINSGGITFTGANAADFSQINTCPVSPATLAAGASCTILLTFKPNDQDSRTAQLSVASTAPIATMNLSGFGSVPEVSLSTTSINFGTNDPLNVGVINFVSITNKGGAPLHVGNVEITGPDASAFSVTFNSCANVVISANGGSCFIDPTFLPTTAGHAYSATLLINDDAAGSPQSVSMSGTGVAQVNVTPHSLEFGGWLVGTQSLDSQISLQNGTAGNITLTSIAPSGSSGDFPIDPNNNTTCVANLVLLPGISCQLDVFFKPTVGSALDGRTATYTFNWTGAASGSQAVTVMGTGETGFTLYQNNYTAPSEYVGATESRTNFDQVFNGNGFPVTVSSIVISGANPQDFVVQLDTSCSTNGVVAANSVCFLDGSFSPSAVGVRSATVTINYNPPTGSSLILNVTGSGIPGPVVFPTNYDMGSQIVGLTGTTQRVVLQNVQKTQLAISTVTPPAGTEFAIAPNSTCKSGVNVQGGGTCFIDLTFTPGGTGSRTASIVVNDNGPGSPRTLNLTGTGEPAADTISVTPNALDFGNVVLVVSPAVQPTVSATFYLINGGTTSTTISVAPALTTAGTPFAIPTGPGTGTCILNAVLLPQGGTCSVVVTFKPTATGKITNSVTLTDSVGGLHTVPIQATGVNQGVMSFGSSPTFNQLRNTTTATPVTATLTNSGSGPLTITSLNLTGTNSTDFAIVPGQTTCAPGTTGVTLTAAPGPGNTCVVALTFTAPNTIGSYTARVSVTANLGNGVSGSTSTGLTGNVVAGGISASPSPINFGAVALGTAIDFNTVNNSNPNNGNFVVLTNNNTTPVTITSIVPQNAGDYTITSFSNSCPASPSQLSNLQFQNTCTFNVTLTPTVTGAEPANNIVINYNAGGPNTQLLIPLNGSGSNALTAMPNPLNVSAAVGGFGGNPTITIGNGSASTVNVTGVGPISGTGAANFKISFEFCTGTALQPTGSAFGTTCQISLTYNPTAPGTNVPAQIPVMYNIGGGATQTLTVNLNSSATAAQVSIVPSQSTPTPLVFPSPGLPNQGINTQSLVLSVLVTNTGNDVLNFTNVKITGTNSNDFAFAPQNSNFESQYPNILACFGFGFGNSIQPGQSCTIPLTFTPGPPPLPGGTTRNATLTITDNAFPNKTQTVPLEGNSTSGNVTVSPTTLPFPDTNVGASATQSVLLMNGTNTAVTFTNVTFGTSSYSVDATQTLNACSASKPLSAFTGSCTVYIKFTPVLGANPDTATIHTSGGAPTVLLSGNGKSSTVTVSPTSLTFTTPQLVGTQSSPLPVTLTNGTSSTITISSTPTASGDFILGTNSCTSGAAITAGNTCTVNIIFKPTATGTRNGTLVIADATDANSPHNVPLTGTGTAPATITATSGATQSVVVNNAFATLQAVVKDSGGNVLPGVSVTFTITAAVSGASGTFTGGVTTAQVTTDVNGLATAPTLTANDVPGGPFTVAATAGAIGPANFSLTNLAGTPASITATLGTPQSVAVGTVFASLQATVKDGNSLPLSGVTVTFNAPSSGASGTFTGGTNGGLTATAVTNTSGVATAPTFTANSTAGGPYTVTATAGAVGPANFSLTNLTGPAASITATAGTPQSAAITKSFTTNLQATVKDSKGNLLGGVLVTFTAPSSGASGTFAGGTSGGTVVTATTNASGVATATVFTANSTVGGYTVNATVSGVATPAAFSLTNLAGPPATITATAGTPQNAAVTAAFITNLQATVKDAGGNLVSGATVTFTAPSSGASGTFVGGTSGGTTVTAITNASGVATASVFTANSTIGGYTVNATVSGVATPAAFSLNNIAGPPASIAATAGTPQSVTISTAFVTNLQATVKDAGGNLVNGATVTFTAPSSGASGTFVGGTSGGTTVTAITNASGVATAPVFTANSTAGAYSVNATVSGVTTPAAFSLTNLAGAAATITATSGTPQSVQISTAFAALQATVKDSGGNLVSGATVTFTVTAAGSGASGTFAGGTSGGTVVTAITNASGVASASTLTANTIAGGPFTVKATSGAATSATYSLTNLTGPAASIAATAGTPQSAAITKSFTNNLQATVKDSGGNLVSGVTVTFTAPSSGASGTFTGGTNGGLTATATTNASGVASAPVFTANSTAGGPYNVTATAGAIGPANFALTNLAGAAASITATAGTPQSIAINTAFPTNLQATVKDGSGNLLSGVVVTFTAPSSGASGVFTGGANGGLTATASTNASGVATAPVFTANSTAGGPYNVTATATGIGPANFSLTNLSAPPASIAATSGTPQSTAISTVFTTNLQATVEDKNGLPIAGATVTFTAPSSGASGTFTGGTNGGLTATATTNASGVATAPVFTANTVAGGPYNVQATAGAFSANFVLTNLTGPAASVTATGGATQSVVINTAFAALQVTVKDSGGNPVNNATVTFTAPASGASGAFAGGTSGGTTVTATTGASGVATASTFTANSVAGAYTVNASVSGITTKAAFSLTNLPGPASKMIISGGGSQSVAVNTAFTALAVTVTDASGNDISGVSVTFTAPSSGPSGTFTGGTNGGTTAIVITGANGVATAPTFTSNNSVGGPYLVAASASGLTTVDFSLTNLAGTPASIAVSSGSNQSVAINTAFATLVAIVKDNKSIPLSGVVVTFTAPSSGASGAFVGGTNGGTTVTATTDSNGNATAPLFTANGTAGGPYTVAATAGTLAPANFSLTNLAGAPFSVTATAGATQSAVISTAFTTNLGVTVKDNGGNLLSGVIVTFTAPSSGASGVFTGGTNGGLTITSTTGSNGVATAAVFTANATVGAYTVHATASGVATPASFSLTNTAGPPASITATAGTPQSVTISKAFPTALAATVKDSGGNPVNGVTVTFTAPSSGASGTFAGGTSGGTVVTATTNASGVATAAAFTANGTAGAYTVNATVTGVTAPAAFSLTNLAGPPATITATAGTPQSAPVTTAFPTALQATVKDSGGNLVSGASVTFTAPASGASGTFTGGTNGGTTITVTTNSSGVATAPAFTANATGGAYNVNASVAGVAANAVFALTNTVAPDITIVKSHTGAFTVGQNGTYTIKVTNNGTGPTTGTVTVTDTLPAGLTFISGSTTGGWSCAAAGQTVTCTNATVGVLAAKGGNSTVTLTVSVGPSAISSPTNFTVTNSASVSDPGDSNTTDKTFTDAPTNLANAIPTVSAISPALGLIAGATSAQQITFTGSGFNSTTQVNGFGSSALTGTASADGTSLTISVPAAALATPGKLSVTVTNPATNGGGGSAAAQTFPLVAVTASQDASTPGTIAVTAGTPATVKIDYVTNPANTPLPAALTVTCSVPMSLTGATCSVNGGTIAAGATTGSASVTINAIPTTGTTSNAPGTVGKGPWSLNLLWLVAAVLLAMLAMMRKFQQQASQFRRVPAYLVLLLLVGAGGIMVGCTTAAKTTPTPIGPSTILVTATTADGATVTTTVNINVTN